MSDFREYVTRCYPGADVVALSESNNMVYRVDAPGGSIVAKHVLDADIPIAWLAGANAALAATVPVQQILRVLDTACGDPYDAVFAEYVEGDNLADVLHDDGQRVTDAELADYLCRFVVACRDMPQLRDGYGLFKRSAVVDDDHAGFVVRHVRRYWQRVRPHLDATPVRDVVDDWVTHGLAAALSQAGGVRHHVIAIDANLRNFVVTPDGRIVVLNVPIAARSTSAHAVAAVAVHLRHRSVHDVFTAAASRSVCRDDADLVPHFELWHLLGVLSFYAVRDPEHRAQWRNWGSPVPLLEDLDGLVRALLLSGGPS